ncbi:MAG: shikimate dehydrogenase [Gammaproteobacteria bacterium]
MSERISDQTADRYCVIGNPIAHSRSPDIHAAFARQTRHQLVYERCLAPLDGFEATVRELIAQGYRGANVTVPFKLEAAAIADVLTERGKAAGAINTLVFADGQIRGDNTDGAGLVNDILNNAGARIEGKTILMLGAGGASQGCILPLLGQNPAELVVANRTRANADKLIDRFAGAAGGKLFAVEYEEIDSDFDIVINGTSASLADSLPPVPERAFSTSTLALDMMYGAKPSRFMAFAAEQGAVTRDGLGMLVEQAAEAFFVWRGVRPDTDAVLQQIRSAL